VNNHRIELTLSYHDDLIRVLNRGHSKQASKVKMLVGYKTYETGMLGVNLYFVLCSLPTARTLNLTGSQSRQSRPFFFFDEPLSLYSGK
jgi:hypothetical protein